MMLQIQKKPNSPHKYQDESSQEFMIQITANSINMVKSANDQVLSGENNF